MKLILFDIDGTLVNVRSEVTRNAIRQVLATVLDHHDDLGEVELHGKTDRQIMLELCQIVGCAGDAALANVEPMTDVLLAHWERHLSSETVELLPGVGDLLERLSNTEGVALGLLTGNLERAARMKLAPHDLNRYFPFGSFGSDAVRREDLPPIALGRANGLGDERFSYERTMIIGDSHRDIACARAWGIRALAVATGGMSADELRLHSPDGLCESLLESEYIFEFIDGE